MSNTDIHVGLVFTRNVTLAEWKEQGLYDREILLYQSLQKSGVSVSFFTYDTVPIDAEPGIDVHIKKYAWLPNMLYSFLMPMVHQKAFRKCTILKSNQIDGSWAVILGALIYRIPSLIRGGFEWYQVSKKIGRGRLYRALVYTIEWLVYRMASHIVLTSPTDAAFVRKSFPFTTKKLQVIPNFINTDLFAPKNIYAEQVSDILYIGRLNPEKNVNSLIRAMDGLPMRLTIVGDGKLRDSLESLAKTLDVDVRFTGNIPNKKLPAMLQAADLYVQPSHFEGYPKTVLEAMSCGVPVIVSDVSGNNDIVTNAVTGVYCQTSAESIREQICFVSEQGKEFRKNIGMQARAWITSHVSLPDVTKQELSVYKQLQTL
jgi:glycosyltransferase involved in cell wall biosynthesis